LIRENELEARPKQDSRRAFVSAIALSFPGSQQQPKQNEFAVAPYRVLGKLGLATPSASLPRNSPGRSVITWLNWSQSLNWSQLKLNLLENKELGGSV
jgi:hypothetical protein